LILAGDDDRIISLVNAQIMHRLIPRSQLHSYHGGHLDLATDAQSLAPVLEALLTAQTRDGTAAATAMRRPAWGRCRGRSLTAGWKPAAIFG
jgi:hypothetical protein